MKERVFSRGSNFQLYEAPPERRGSWCCVRLSAFDAECVFCVDDTLEVLLPTDFGASLVDYVHGALPLNSADRILDVGCGSGIYPITLARRGYADITAIDVNQEAILQTTRNMQRNCVKAAAVRLVYADVCSFDLERPYDLVVSNPSHLPAHPDYDLGRGIDVAALAGPDGRKMYDAIIDRATELVAPGGRLLLAHSSLANVPRTLERLEEIGFHTSVAMRNEMDIPLLAYEPHRNLLFSQLERLARHGAAEFAGDRFWVYIVDATKA